MGKKFNKAQKNKEQVEVEVRPAWVYEGDDGEHCYLNRVTHDFTNIEPKRKYMKAKLVKKVSDRIYRVKLVKSYCSNFDLPEEKGYKTHSNEEECRQNECRDDDCDFDYNEERCSNCPNHCKWILKEVEVLAGEDQ